jgi:hypothetical protein
MVAGLAFTKPPEIFIPMRNKQQVMLFVGAYGNVLLQVFSLCMDFSVSTNITSKHNDSITVRLWMYIYINLRD